MKGIMLVICVASCMVALVAAVVAKPVTPSTFRADTIGQVTVRGYSVPCDRELCELAVARICSDGRTFPDGTPIVGATWEPSRGMICAARCGNPMNTLVVMNCSNNYSVEQGNECRTALAHEAFTPDVFADDDSWMLPPECRVDPDGIVEGPDGFPFGVER